MVAKFQERWRISLLGAQKAVGNKCNCFYFLDESHDWHV